MANQIIKVYGLTKVDIESKIQTVKNEYKNQIKVSIKEKYLDSTLDISCEK